jgi:spore photoproduct lyase
MHRFPVEHVYLVDTVQSDSRALRRAERLSSAMGVPSPTVITVEQSLEIRHSRQAAQPGTYPRRTGEFDYSRGWKVVLDTFCDKDHFADRIPRTTYRDGGKQMGGQGVCRSALELHGAFGCYHRCAYCFVDPYFLIACDLETLAERIPEYCERFPAQKLWKFDALTDTIVLEPEYGASELLVPLFAELEDRYLLLYTKSDNVDHLLRLKHDGHTIVNWSLSPLTQSRTIEINAPDTFGRIAAMKKCADAGYTVRVRISPVVPLQGWRDEFVEMADALFSSVKPDVVTIDVVGWCYPEALDAAMDISRFEPEFAEEVRAGLGVSNRKAEKYLFSHDLRISALRHVVAELKKRSPETPVALCNETREMWDGLADLLAMRPSDYVCCCGPDCAPGHGMLRTLAAP